MQIDLRTVTITPLRQTYGHLARRMGVDKPASRYMEATMDLQPVENYHYRPTWEPDRDIFDTRRTQVTMKDWYALKDPRQYYYGTWVLARGRMQETAEADFDLVEQLGLAASYPAAVRDEALKVMLPLRHVAYAANIIDCYVAAYGYGIGISQATCYASMDQLGIAQYVTRLALAFNEVDALAAAKQAWLDAPEWQGMRRLVEDMMVETDWFEVLVAQDFVLNGLLFPLIYERYNDKLNASVGPVFSMLTRFQREWYAENVRWIDAQMKAAVADNAENKALIGAWVAKWKARASEALAPLAQLAFGADGVAVLEEVSRQLDARAAKAGVPA